MIPKHLDIERIKTYSLEKRVSKVSAKDFADTECLRDVLHFIDGLPDILAARDLREIIDAWVKARLDNRPVIIGMGAHVIKVGLNPVIIELMKRGLVTGLACNGACMVHDSELAIIGMTSEDVAAELGSGSFGMASETSECVNAAATVARENGCGLGAALGEYLEKNNFKYNDISLHVAAYRMGIPLTVHVAIGTDIIHLHPSADGAAIGEASLYDFHTFAAEIAGLERGLYINLGSAVILPEIFLKAITLVRNLEYKVNNFTTVNMDFIRHYRPMTNVVTRPTGAGGKGYSIVGHHEIMFPLLAGAVMQKMDKTP